MSLLRSIRQQLGLMSGGNESQNHFFDGSVPNQLTLKRGTPDAPGATVMQVVDGVVSFPQTQGGPALRMYQSVNVPFGGGAAIGVVFDSTDFDTNNSRNGQTFRPNVPGYYQCNAGVYLTGSGSPTYMTMNILKNNDLYCASQGQPPYAGLYASLTASCLIYLNGTTDYVNVTAEMGNSGTGEERSGTFFSAFLARKA